MLICYVTYKFMHLVWLANRSFLLRTGILIGPKVLAACVIFTVVSRFTVCLSNTNAVTSSACCTATVTVLCNDANSDIGSHHYAAGREAANNEGNRWEQENGVSENNKASSKNE